MMDCPICCGKTKVYNTCMLTLDNELPRWRKCLECGHRFVTLERIVPDKEPARRIKNEKNTL